MTRERTRHQIPGRGGSGPVGDRPKAKTSITVDADVLEAARDRVGARGLSGEIERLLRAWLADDA